MPNREPETAADAAARRQVADLQRRARGRFLLMYSLYWRRYIAIYMGKSEHNIILQSDSPEELWQLMDGVAPPDWQADGIPPRAGGLSETVSGQEVLPELQRRHG